MQAFCKALGAPSNWTAGQTNPQQHGTNLLLPYEPQLFSVSQDDSDDGTGELKLEQATTGAGWRTALMQHSAAVISTNHEVWCWAGSRASPRVRVAASSLARELPGALGLPYWVKVTRVEQKFEPGLLLRVVGIPNYDVILSKEMLRLPSHERRVKPGVAWYSK